MDFMSGCLQAIGFADHCSPGSRLIPRLAALLQEVLKSTDPPLLFQHRSREPSWADPNVTDKTNSIDHWAKTPILAAAGSGDSETLKLLLATDVDPNQRTGFLTPFAVRAERQ